jgi:hypothetical protein
MSCLASSKEPVDYVIPYIGGISHLLVPTCPTTHLPNSMIRMYPLRGELTHDRIEGFPLNITSHRGEAQSIVRRKPGEEFQI